MRDSFEFNESEILPHSLLTYDMFLNREGPNSISKNKLNFDIPYVISGIPGNQLCIIHIDDNTYAILSSGIPMDEVEHGVCGIVTISLNGDLDFRDEWEKCPYCKGTGVHLVEGYSNYYWLCRNCKTNGYSRIKNEND